MSTVLTSPAPEVALALWPRTGQPPQYLEDAEVAALEAALGQGYLDIPPRDSNRKDRSAYTVWRSYCRRQRRPLVCMRRHYRSEWAEVTLSTDAEVDEPDRSGARRRLDEPGYAQARRIGLGAFAAWVEDPGVVARSREFWFSWSGGVPEVRPHYVRLSVPQDEAVLMAQTLLDLCAEHLEDVPGK
jgi:hypothetical protein